MHVRRKPVVLICLIISVLTTEVFSGENNYKHKIESFHNFKQDNFELYLDSVLTGNWQSDSIEIYFNWLQQNKSLFLSSENEFTKAAYFTELACLNHVMKNDSLSHRNLEDALYFIEKYSSSPVFIKLLRLGKNISVLNGDYIKAIEFLKKIELSGYYKPASKELSDVMLDIADYYWNMHQYNNSINYCRKVFPLLTYQNYEKGKIRAFSTMYNNAHFTTSDTTAADYLYQALEIAKSINDSVSLANIYENLGLSFYRNSNQQEAIKYYKLSRSYQKEKGSQADIYTSLFLQLSYTLADSVEAVGELSEFIVRQAEKKDYYKSLSNAYRGRAWYFAKTGRRDSAVYYLDAAFENRQSLPEKKDASPGFYYYLFEVADILNDNERAVKFLSLSHNQYVNAQRSLNAQELNEIRANFDYQLQKEKIERLTIQNKLEKEINARQKLVIATVLLLLMAGIIFWVFARSKYTQLRESYRALIKKNIELDKLYTRLSKTEQKLVHPKNGNVNGNGIGNGVKVYEKIYRKLKVLLEEEKIFKQADLSVSRLAKKLKTNTSYLSAIINNRFEESFKTVINKYRIDEARRLLASAEYKNFSIEGIAEEVGYHSRSTFYQSFKQITGLTPSQYQSNLNSIPPETEE
jgi:AraC-like DNA-binding protein